MSMRKGVGRDRKRVREGAGATEEKRARELFLKNQ